MKTNKKSQDLSELIIKIVFILITIGTPIWVIFFQNRVIEAQNSSLEKVAIYASNPQYKEYIMEIYSDDFVSAHEYNCLMAKVKHNEHNAVKQKFKSQIANNLFND